MAESNALFNFGVTDATIFNLPNGTPDIHLRVLGDVAGEFSADTAKVEGGSQNFPWAIAITGFKGSIKLKCKEVNPGAIALALGGTLTTETPSATGSVIDISNIDDGTLLSSTGFVSVSVTSDKSGNLKPGWYLAEALSATTFSVKAYSQAGQTIGPDVSFSDDDLTLDLTGSPFTIPSTPGETLAVEDLGLTFTRGAAARSVTTGDTFRFYVLPPYEVAYNIAFGEATANFRDVGLVVSSEISGDNELTQAMFYRCKIYGGQIPFNQKKFAEYDFTIEPQFDSVEQKVGDIKVLKLAS